MIKNFQKRIKLVYLIVFLLLIVCLLCWFYLFQKSAIQQDSYYILKPTSTLQDVANDLHNQINLKNPRLFYLFARLEGADNQLKAGEYFFPKGSTINDILTRLVKGIMFYHQFTIVNGWTLNQVMNALNNNPYLIHQLSHLSDKAVAKTIGCSHPSLEGWLYPSTYRFHKETTDLALLQKAYQAMQEKLNQEWNQRASHLVYQNSYQVLIVASMIEKETSTNAERPMIAAVILKRLKIWMPLQIDSTVIYGLGKHYTGELTHQDLRRDTIYNTYTRYGLPPTPIAMPSLSSIHAALHPADTDSLYFVSKGDGSHQFSTTLKDHDAAIDQYQLKSNETPRANTQHP